MRFEALLRDVRACRLCASSLEHEPRPILQLDPAARILIAGQAPGRRAHEAGRPFQDPSGERLREWMGIDSASFYDPSRIAILPMGFCFPGRGSSGDRPPRRECAPAWRERLLEELRDLRLSLLIGSYAQAYHLDAKPASLTETVKVWRDFGPRCMPLPHPSPRNRGWPQRNPWFERELLPVLRRRVRRALAA